MACEKTNLTRILEIVTVLRTTPDDETTSKLIVELESLAKPKRKYDLSAECLEKITASCADIQSDTWREACIKRTVKEEHNGATGELAREILSGVSELEHIRGRNALRGESLDYSNVFEGVLKMIRPDGLCTEMYL
jgi:hypothetical protein